MLADLIIDAGTTVACQIESISKDSAGGAVSTWNTMGIFPAMIRPAGANLITMYAQRSIDVTHKILFAIDLRTALPNGGISTQYRIRETGVNGRIFQVQGYEDSDLILSAQTVFRVDTMVRVSPN